MNEKQRRRLKAILKKNLSKHRYEHCLCVSEEAGRLAEIHSGDAERAELAGLMHDVTKEMSEKQQLALVRKSGIASEDELCIPQKLLHAVSGAAFLVCELGIEDKDVINAVRYHTTGRAGMSKLEKIIYIADFTSADRDYSDVGTMRELAGSSLEDAMLYALRYTITNSMGKGCFLHPASVAAYNELVGIR